MTVSGLKSQLNEIFPSFGFKLFGMFCTLPHIITESEVKMQYISLKLCTLNFSIIFILNTNTLTSVEGRDPKGTPLDELLRKQTTVCKGINGTLINQARLEWSSCIDSFILRPNDDIDEFDELRQYYSYFCRDEKRFKGCWKNVTNLLNHCEPGRGDVSKQIYFAIYDLTCRNNGSVTASNIIKSVEHGEDLCELNYLTKTCNETRKNWYSIDICRRYEAQKVCEQAAVVSCANSVHKEMLLKNLHEIGSTLKCAGPYTSSATIKKNWTNLCILSSCVTLLWYFVDRTRNSR